MHDSANDDRQYTNAMETPCPACGTNVADWIPACPQCGQQMRTQAEAARAELRHIAYLQAQIAAWQSGNVFSSLAANRMQNEIESRRKTLFALVSPPSVPFPAVQSPPVVPVLPPLPTGVNAPAPLWGAALDTPAHPPQPAGAAPLQQAVPVSPPARRAAGSPARLAPSRPIDYSRFLQAHGLKLVFALATLLVVFALRSIIAWQEVGAIVIRLVPAALLGLTAMFWMFGQRTQEENPWAAFVYHGMAALLVAFDVAAINRYWLGAMGISLPVKPVLLLSCLAGTATAGALLLRCRQIPYLHLLQAGVLITLYAALQFLRLMLWNQQDFHAAPITLFGCAYLALAGLNFAYARRAKQSAASQSAPSSPGGSDLPPAASPQHGSVDAEASPFSSPNAAAPVSGWAVAWALWAHLSVAAVILISSLNILLQNQVHLNDLAALALLGGILYAAGAQMLEEPRMAQVSGGLTALSLLFWLANSYSLLWNRFSFLLMALSAAWLALAAYNEKRAGNQAIGTELATAWRTIARYGIFLAAALAGFQILSRWPASLSHDVPVDIALTGLGEAVLSGVFLLALAHWENRFDCLYGALLAGGLALISALEGVHASTGAYGLAFMLYGWALYSIALAIKSQKRGVRRAQASAIPLPEPKGTEKRPNWLEESVFSRGAHVAAGLGLLIAAVLPVNGLAAVWAWTTATMVLGSALYAVTAQKEASLLSMYASLLCMAYASGLVVWRISPQNVSFADIIAPYALATALLALLIDRRRRVLPHAPASEGTVPSASPDIASSDWEAWREPLAVMSLLSIAGCIANGLLTLISGHFMAHPALSLLPALVASLLLIAARRETGQDTLRSLSTALLNAAVAIEIASLCRLTGGVADWPLERVQMTCLLWVLQGWVFWGIGWLFSRTQTTKNWSNGFVANGMAAALMGVLILTLKGIGASGDRSLLLLCFVLSSAYCLLFLQTWLTGGAVSRRLSLLIVLLASLAFIAHTLPHHLTMGSATPFYPTVPFVSVLVTLFFVGAAASYFALAFKQQEPEFSYLALLPLTLGYGLFALWKSEGLIPLAHRSILETIWLVAGVGAGLSYLKTARQHSQSSFAMLSALLLTAVYGHAVSLAGHPPAQWHALILLPFLIALYAYGAVTEAAEEFIGKPFRSVALAVSGIALFWSAVQGDALVPAAEAASAHALISWTLFAYGLAYAILAFRRQSPVSVGIGAAVLTAAYLHALLTQTEFWQMPGNPVLSWPRFACLANMAGCPWLTLAWLLRRRLARKDLTLPLLTLTGVLAFFCAWIAFITHTAPGQGDWSLLTLGCAALLWLGMWILEAGEICWHVAAWNLLAAWALFIPLHLGLEHTKFDLYLLPAGIYLLLIGHRSSSRGQSDMARGAWWLGLLTILSPAFLLYWTNAPGRHEILLIGECALITLLGVAQRIRAYVSAGLAFATLLTAASIIGHLPYYAGTLLALAVGVSLFIAGFYALTHRETLQRWLSRLGMQWQQWQAWR